jgi:hypothetical protein
MNEIANKAAYYARVAQYASDGFSQVYLGAKDVAPTTDNNGNPLIVGALYFNTVSDTLYVWDGAAWDISTNFNETTPFLSTGSTATINLQNRFAEVRNVKDFGAIGDGVADDTAAIQAAITAAGVSGTVILPKGTYLLSATLNALTNQNIIGDGPNQTILRRFTDYGDTLRFANIGAGSVRNIWFYHGTMPSAGFTSLTNKATSGAHLHIVASQGAVIEDCWFWRMPYQVQFDSGSISRINRCNAQGSWSLTAGAPAQEGIAGIYLGAAGICTLMEITNCYLAGSDGGAQSISFTISDNGTQVVNFASTNAGNLYGILVNSCEGLVIDSTYIGGNSRNNIRISPNNICSELRISNNFFDSGNYNEPCLYFVTSVVGSYANRVTVSDNTFNGQLYGLQNIASLNTLGTSQPAIVNFTIVGNSIANSLGSGIFLRNATNGTISNNQITAYNSRNLSPGGDVNYCNAVYLIDCVSVLVEGNIIGGAINSGAVGGYTYRGIEFAGTINNVVERDTVHVGTGPSANIVGKSDKYIVSTVNLSYTCTGNEDLVLTDTTTSPLQVILPANPPKGMSITVKDSTGTLSISNFCSIVGTIDNATNLLMIVPYMSRTVTYNGTNWNITGGYN